MAANHSSSITLGRGSLCMMNLSLYDAFADLLEAQESMPGGSMFTTGSRPVTLSAATLSPRGLNGNNVTLICSRRPRTLKTTRTEWFPKVALVYTPEQNRTPPFMVTFFMVPMDQDGRPPVKGKPDPLVTSPPLSSTTPPMWIIANPFIPTPTQDRVTATTPAFCTDGQVPYTVGETELNRFEGICLTIRSAWIALSDAKNRAGAARDARHFLKMNTHSSLSNPTPGNTPSVLRQGFHNMTRFMRRGASRINLHISEN